MGNTKEHLRTTSNQVTHGRTPEFGNVHELTKGHTPEIGNIHELTMGHTSEIGDIHELINCLAPEFVIGRQGAEDEVGLRFLNANLIATKLGSRCLT